MADKLQVDVRKEGALKRAINSKGWLSEEVVAAGQLRQGKVPSMKSMMLGSALVEVLRPKRSKLLPRHFVLAATDDRVIAFKARGSGDEDTDLYYAHFNSEEAGSWPRGSVRITDLEDGERSNGGTLVIGNESMPINRPNQNGDPSTNELLKLLSE
jgi:hypothetical protein